MGPKQNTRRLTNLYLVLPVVAFIVFIQATLLARVHLFGATPHALLAVIVAWSLIGGVEAGLVWAFVGGLIFDLVAGLPAGTSSLALMAICFLSGLGETNLFQGNVFLPVILVLLASPLHGWIVLLIEQARGLAIDWPGVTMRVILPEAALNVAVIVLAYPVLRWLAQQAGVERLNW